MALSLTSSVADVGGTLAFQTSATAAIDTLKGSSGTLYKVEIDNSANSVAVFVKLYNNGGGAPTAGSTDPNFVFKCAASSTIAYSCPSGTAFANALYAICVTTAGTAGTASQNPEAAVTYRILYT